MRLTFATDDQAYSVDVDPEMELGDMMALLEAESGIPTSQQAIFLGAKHLNNPKATLQSYGIKDDDMLMLRDTQAPSTSRGLSSSSVSQQQSSSAGDVNSPAEIARGQLLANADLMQQLREAEPEIAEAAMNNPAKFRELYNARGDRYRRMQEEKRQMEQLVMADPFDIDAQRKIEEAIRQERVLENMEHAMEFSPESFGRVTMLYVDVEVNGHKVKAFVDSGAQATIISPECAEACNIMRLLDTRFSGIARGVGTARILGRIHSAQIKVGSDLYLPCAFTIMEGKGVDLLFGLDMLKRYQACIDLEKNVLRIQGREVRFLAEHELPRNALDEELEVDENGNVKLPASQANQGAAMGAAASASAQAIGQGGSSQSGQATAQRSPGSGNTINASAANTSSYPEEKISALTSMGVGRDEAVRLLDAAGGSV